MFLFVYGSLKRGQKLHRLLKEATFQKTVETEPNYLLYDGLGVYFVEVKDGEGRCIEGELYEVTQEILEKLDRLGKDKFHRQTVKIKNFEDEVYGYTFRGGVSQYLDCGTSWPRE